MFQASGVATLPCSPATLFVSPSNVSKDVFFDDNASFRSVGDDSLCEFKDVVEEDPQPSVVTVTMTGNRYVVKLHM